MITKEKINGREATCVFLKKDLTPCSIEDAELVKVIFHDDKSTMWLTPAEGDEGGEAEPSPAESELENQE